MLIFSASPQLCVRVLAALVIELALLLIEPLEVSFESIMLALLFVCNVILLLSAVILSSLLAPARVTLKEPLALYFALIVPLFVSKSMSVLFVLLPKTIEPLLVFFKVILVSDVFVSNSMFPSEVIPMLLFETTLVSAEEFNFIFPFDPTFTPEFPSTLISESLVIFILFVEYNSAFL